MKNTKLVALTGILTALSVVLMFLGSIISVLAYVMPITAGVLIIVIKEYSIKYSWIMFVTVSIISALMLPDKECALTYVFFFGYYPIIRDKILLIKNKMLQWILRFLVFNFGIISSQLICLYVFGIPFDDVFGKWGIVILLLLANVVLLVYEKMIVAVNLLYHKKYRKTVDKLLK